MYIIGWIGEYMDMRVAKWGNSLAVRLPSELVRDLGLKAGDRIELERAGDHLAVRRRPTPEDVLAALHKFRGRLTSVQRLSRDDANAR